MASKQRPKRKTTELQQLLSKTGRRNTNKPISPPPTSTALTSDIKSDTKSSPSKTRPTRRQVLSTKPSKNITVNSSPKPSSPFKNPEAPTLPPPSSSQKPPGSPSKKRARHANLNATPSMRIATAKAKTGLSVFQDADVLLSPRVGEELPSLRGPFMKGAIVEDGPLRPKSGNAPLRSGMKAVAGTARSVSPFRSPVTQTYGAKRQSLRGHPKNNAKPVKASKLEETVWDIPSSPQAQRRNASNKMPPAQKSDPSIRDTASPPSVQSQKPAVIAKSKPNARRQKQQQQQQPPQKKKQEPKKPPSKKAAAKKRQPTPVLISSDPESGSDLTVSDEDESDEEFVPSVGAKRKRADKETQPLAPDRAPKSARTRRADTAAAKKAETPVEKSAGAQKDKAEPRSVPMPIPPVTPIAPITSAAPVASMSPVASMVPTAPMAQMMQSILKSPEKAKDGFTLRAEPCKNPSGKELPREFPREVQYDSTPETLPRQPKSPAVSGPELLISDFESEEEGVDNEDEDEDDEDEDEEEEEATPPKKSVARATRSRKAPEKSDAPPSPLDIITKLLSAVDSSTLASDHDPVPAPAPAPKKKRNSRAEKNVLSRPSKKQKTTYISTNSGIGDLSSLLRSKLQGTQSKKAKAETRKFLLETDELFTRRNAEFVSGLETESEKLANKLQKVYSAIVKRFDEFSHLNTTEPSEAQTAKNTVDDIRRESKRAMDIYEYAQNGFKKHQAQVPVERWGKDWDEVDEIIELGEAVGEKIIKAHVSAETEPGAAYKKLMKEMSEKEKEVAAVLFPESLKELEEKSWGQAVWGLWDVLNSIAQVTSKT